MPNDWHLVHLGSRAVGGASLVMVEAYSRSPRDASHHMDSGLWSSEPTGGAFSRITAYYKKPGAIPGIQLAHVWAQSINGIFPGGEGARWMRAQGVGRSNSSQPGSF